MMFVAFWLSCTDHKVLTVYGVTCLALIELLRLLK